jgi:hypothetical protein
MGKRRNRKRGRGRGKEAAPLVGIITNDKGEKGLLERYGGEFHYVEAAET